MRNRVIFLIFLTCTLAMGFEAAWFDELTPLYPDSKVSEGTRATTLHIPVSTPAGVHLLVTGLPKGASIELPEVPGGTWSQLIAVPVEENTGLDSRTEVFTGKHNPHVIRRAPFRVYEAIQPLQGKPAVADESGTAALRLTVLNDQALEINVPLTHDGRTLDLRLSHHPHPVSLPSVSKQKFHYTNWFSLGNIAARHKVEIWSEAWRSLSGRCCSPTIPTPPSVPQYRATRLALLQALEIPASDHRAGDLRWFKGNTHTHSLWSDGNDFPEMIADWYKTHGYNFLVLSDHNTLSAGERWMKVADVEKRKQMPGPPVLPKYITRFGKEWVETRGEGESEQVRLRTLAEIRPKFEEPGKFLMIEGEEITDHYQGAQIHMNAMNLSKVIAPRHGDSIQDTMRNNLRAVLEEEARTGRPILPHLNHPNFQWSLTATDIAEVLEERFVEIYNGHPGTHHLGDATRPGDEMNFDIANTLRLTRLKSEPLYAVATDDSHNYHGGDVSPGRGWVMVRAASLRAEDLIAAMRAGDFYASSGVTLKDLRFDAATGELRIEIEPDGDATYVTRFIGTLASEPENRGQVLDTSSGLVATYKLTGDELYVRATITSSLAHANPSFKEQRRQAWTQPVGWKKPRP